MSDTGRQWEIALEAQHRDYERDGLAVVWKTEPRRGANGHYRDKAPPDYIGALEGGRAVVIEAKACGAARFSLGMIKGHQAREMEKAWKRGALVFVALRFGSTGRVLRWEWLREHYGAWRMGKGPASLTERQIAELPAMGGEYGADWLGVLR